MCIHALELPKYHLPSVPFHFFAFVPPAAGSYTKKHDIEYKHYTIIVVAVNVVVYY
jgi:hypothetical protein